MIDEILESFQGEDLEVLNKILRKAIRFFERKYQSFQ